MKILYITEYFSPVNYIAAIRTTKLAKYLSRMGNEITMLTRDWCDDVKKDPNLMRDEKEVCHIIRIDNSRRYSWLYDKVYSTYKKSTFTASNGNPVSDGASSSKNITVKMKIKSFVKEKMNKYMNRDYAKQAMKTLKHYGDNNFDVIISSYGPYSSHIIGNYAKKKYNCRWIADFRDPVEDCIRKTNNSGWANRFRNMVVKNADRIVCVSSGCANNLPNAAIPKTTVITNGFDPDDINVISSGNHKKFYFEMAYAGQLYAGRSKLSVVFRCLKELSCEGKIDINNVKIHYAGNSFDELLRQAREYQLETVLIDHGFVSRDESLRIQSESDALLLASWNSVGNTGVITGKVFEYFMMNKPIICTVSGNLEGSELKQIISESKSGVCYEEAADNTDYSNLKSYIQNRYSIALGNLQDDYSSDRQYINKFTYEDKAEEFDSIIKECVNSNSERYYI